MQIYRHRTYYLHREVSSDASGPITHVERPGIPVTRCQTAGPQKGSSSINPEQTNSKNPQPRANLPLIAHLRTTFLRQPAVQPCLVAIAGVLEVPPAESAAKQGQRLSSPLLVTGAKLDTRWTPAGRQLDARWTRSLRRRADSMKTS